MNKKAIAILGGIFILIVATLGFLIYSKYSSKPATPNTQLTSNQTTTTSTPGTNNGTSGNGDNAPTSTQSSSSNQAVKMTTEPIVSPVLYYNGQGLTYFDIRGGLYRADLVSSNQGLELSRIKKLDIPVKSNISRILWPAQGDNFIAELENSGAKSWSFFDSSTATYTDLPAQIKSVDWMPTGDKIIYVWLENGKATLNISDPDSKNWKQVAEMWETDDAISISPDGLNILYYRTDNNGSANAINLTTPDGKVWKTLVKDGYNKGVLWSPDSKKFLFTKRDPTNQQWQLWYYNLLTEESKNLGISTSLDKVAWDSTGSKVYAAAAPGGAGASDSLYQISIQTLETKQYNLDSQSISATGLFLNQAGDKLFFINNQDGDFYYLDLVTAKTNS